MKTFILIAIVFTTHLCANFATAIPPHIATHNGTSTLFESTLDLDARDFLPPELLKSIHHTVLDQVEPFRLTNHFNISSPFGQFEAYGQDMLRIRVQEIHALAKLKEEGQLDQLTAFGYGVAHAAISPFQFVIHLFTDPVNTALEIPKGLWRATNRVKEMVSGERGQLEDSASQELIGFSIVKRKIANKLGVDAYSSNPVLQDTLDRLSWAGFAGNTGVRLLIIPVAGPAGAILTGTTWSTAVSDLLLDYAPEDLRRLNREKLEDMSIDDSIIEDFLGHEWYSPRHETVIVQALSEMPSVANRGRFLEVAMSAQYEEDALFFQRMAEMLVAYHLTIKPLADIVAIDKQLVMGYASNHTLIAMIPTARLAWQPEVAQAARQIRNWKNPDHPTQKVEVWISGEATPMAAKNLKAMGLTVKTQTRAQLHWASTIGQSDSILTTLR
ncbi:MAG: hypothetical protein O2999_07905 [Nitrospirae bacterium]|nr:hypothetical protein [Nitrospirota bacterium]MDA1304210.1 hypothetical protein [Nitrospirota bacterium]